MKAFSLLAMLVTALAGCGDGSAPGGCTGVPDNDGDGFAGIACGGADCDDTDPNRFPGNVEVCDEDDHDEDCQPRTFGERDEDGDGAFDARCCNTDGVTSFCGNDCNDRNRRMTPGNQEICNGIDDDCDGFVDDGASVEVFIDRDGDGFGEPGTLRRGCPGDPEIFTTDGDCDDDNPQIFPGSIVCTDLSGQFPAAYDFCQVNGMYKPGGSCPAGQVCVQQPGGHGVCEI